MSDSDFDFQNDLDFQWTDEAGDFIWNRIAESLKAFPGKVQAFTFRGLTQILSYAGKVQPFTFRGKIFRDKQDRNKHHGL